MNLARPGLVHICPARGSREAPAGLASPKRARGVPGARGRTPALALARPGRAPPPPAASSTADAGPQVRTAGHLAGAVQADAAIVSRRASSRMSRASVQVDVQSCSAERIMLFSTE